jgi:hypothetical protein
MIAKIHSPALLRHAPAIQGCFRLLPDHFVMNEDDKTISEQSKNIHDEFQCPEWQSEDRRISGSRGEGASGNH